MILKLENDKEIDIYNMTCDEAEMFCDFLIKKFIEENDVLKLDEIQGYESTITQVVFDIYKHNSWIGIIMTNYLHSKYQVSLVGFI